MCVCSRQKKSLVIGMLAAAVVLLAASTAGRERSDCDRGSAARDRSCAGTDRSTNGRLTAGSSVMNDMISNIAARSVYCTVAHSKTRLVTSCNKNKSKHPI